MNSYKTIFAQMVQRLKDKNSVDIYNVVKAFNFAEEKHSTQMRKDGRPYIIHPVCVAEILEKQNFNTDVICAALLHDVVEDCGVSILQIEEKFNKQIAKIVDAVTAIEKEDLSVNDDFIFNDKKDFIKNAAEDRTYQKLISIGKKNKFGFYIKFADRLNNLDTIGCFAKHKKIAKVVETEKWILPLCFLLNSKYFYENIKNYCFELRNQEDCPTFFEHYNNFVELNKMHILQLRNKLLQFLQKNNTKHFVIDVQITPKKPYEVYKNISKKIDVKSPAKVKLSNFLNACCYCLTIITKDNTENDEIASFIYSFLSNKEVGNFKCVGLSKDKFQNNFLQIKDQSRLIYDTTVLGLKQFVKMQNGTTDKTDLDMLDESYSSTVITSYITTYTKDNQKIIIPKQSTVLDFAFKVHNEVGFSCQFAYINDSPQKMPIHTRLQNGDKVELVCKEENGNKVNIANLRWIAY